MASSEDVALSISVVSFFTVIFTFVQPYIAMAVGMPDAVAGNDLRCYCWNILVELLLSFVLNSNVYSHTHVTY